MSKPLSGVKQLAKLKSHDFYSFGTSSATYKILKIKYKCSGANC